MATKTPTTTSKSAEKTIDTSIILGARVTEKAARLSEKNAYVFNVAVGITKSEIKKAFFKRYNVVPTKVHTTTKRQRYSFKRGRLNTVRATKKAYIFVPKGTNITVI